jgi:hypothetical protein
MSTDEHVIETPTGPFTVPGLVHFTTTWTVALADRSHGIFDYGKELLVTADVVEASRDRFGRVWLLDHIRNGNGIHPGPWPEGKSRLLPGSWEYHEAREAARLTAHRELDPQKRSELLAKVNDDYGTITTSRTLTTTDRNRG